MSPPVLPICDDCRSYTFRAEFWHYSSANKFISTVLQFDQIDCCSNVLFQFGIYADLLIELPIDIIANWLNRSRNSNAKGQMENERVLSIEITGVDKVLAKFKEIAGCYIGNISEMLKCLKKVNFNHLILIIWWHKIEKFLFFLNLAILK